MVEPELYPENNESMELFDLVSTEIRLLPNGQYFGPDMGGIATVFSTIGVENAWWELEKMKLIFDKKYKKEETE